MVKHTHTILVVDDIPDWRETIKDLLEDEGYIVVIAESIVEAEEKLKEMSFELAVLDMRLDESDESNIEGLDKLARTIRDNYSHMKTIIFISYVLIGHLTFAQESYDLLYLKGEYEQILKVSQQLKTPDDYYWT